MNTYERLLEHAAQADIMLVQDMDMTASIRMDGACAIFMNEDRYPLYSQRLEALAHEIGHCETGAFYTADSICDNMGKCERTADCWSVFALLPPYKLMQCIDYGAREVYEIAEVSGQSEAFVRKAMEIYKAKGFFGSWQTAS